MRSTGTPVTDSRNAPIRSGIVTTGTDTTYGESISVTRTGATGGAINTYGQNISVTGSTGGTSTIYGLRVAVSGADTNYAAAFTGGNVGIGTATPNASSTLHVADTYGTAYLGYNNGGSEYAVYGNGGACSSSQCVGIYGTTTSNSSTAARAGYFSLANANGYGVEIASATVTSGRLLSLDQYTSTFTGTAIVANMADGAGTFTGAFLDFQKNSVSQFMIDDNGDEFDIYFSDIVGEKCTYKISGSTVEKIGPDAVKYDKYFDIPEEDRKYL